MYVSTTWWRTVIHLCMYVLVYDHDNACVLPYRCACMHVCTCLYVCVRACMLASVYAWNFFLLYSMNILIWKFRQSMPNAFDNLTYLLNVMYRCEFHKIRIINIPGSKRALVRRSVLCRYFFIQLEWQWLQCICIQAQSGTSNFHNFR